jgi:hypothetical protein
MPLNIRDFEKANPGYAVDLTTVAEGTAHRGYR